MSLCLVEAITVYVPGTPPKDSLLKTSAARACSDFGLYKGSPGPGNHEASKSNAGVGGAGAGGVGGVGGVGAGGASGGQQWRLVLE